MPENNRKRVGSTVGTNHARATKRTITWMPTDSLFVRSNIARAQRDALAAAMAALNERRKLPRSG